MRGLKLGEVWYHLFSYAHNPLPLDSMMLFTLTLTPTAELWSIPIGQHHAPHPPLLLPLQDVYQRIPSFSFTMKLVPIMSLKLLD